jgi:hypothetical protein
MRTSFNADEAKDAQIKTFWRGEFADMPTALLQLSFENAQFDANLPLLWQVFSAGRARSNDNAGFAHSIDMSLEGLEIPDQAHALAAISQCKTNQSHAESIAAVATGLRQDPIRKINVAREQQVTNRLVSAAALQRTATVLPWIG